MLYSFVTNVPGCWNSILDMMSGNVNLIYYSYILTIVSILLIGLFVIINGRNLTNWLLFFLCMTFSSWVIINLITWLNCNSIIITTAWTFFGILYTLIAVLSFHLFFVFIYNKDLSKMYKALLYLLTLPMFYLTFVSKIITNFSAIDSTATENNFVTTYYYSVGFFIIFLILFVFLYNYKLIATEDKRKNIIFVSGLELFLIMFFSIGFISDYYYNYGIEFYSLFGMAVFMGILAYLIVKFKVLNIKLIAAQALVWALVILIGSQFLFISGLVSQILAGVTLIVSSILGFNLVSSVKKEVLLREQLEVANAGQKNLIHIMNHQIKGYLSVSKNIFAELLTDDYGKVPAEARDLISQGLQNVDKGAKYVSDILRGESAEKGTLSFEIIKFDFKELVTEVVKRETEMAEKKGLKLTLEVSDGDYYINGDVSHVGEAVRNLIDNSIYYTPTGSVAVSLSLGNCVVLLKVKDTGIGIKPEDAPKLFKAGGVGSDSIKVNTNSSGYGLAFVKGVIEKHNGRVWFESEGQGKGSTFYLEIPSCNVSSK